MASERVEMDRHPNAVLLEKFYTAFAARDHATMGFCYLPNARFEDEVFSLSGKEIPAMWHMLCQNAQEFKLTFRDVEADDKDGRAHWEADYLFSATGRPVHNVIDAKILFSKGGILAHKDSFPFWPWARQALGLPGSLLGWSSFMRNKVRKTARKNLERFIEKHPEYQ